MISWWDIRKVLIFDDLVDSGLTMKEAIGYFLPIQDIRTAVLFQKQTTRFLPTYTYKKVGKERIKFIYEDLFLVCNNLIMYLLWEPIFYSLQWEWRNTWNPSIFIRFYGCDRLCKFCDSLYSVNEPKEYYQENIRRDDRRY